MSSDSFFRKLNSILSDPAAKQLPLDNLKADELSVAKLINAEIKKATKYEQLAKGSLSVIERAESFHDKIVSVISAMIKLGSLGKVERDVEGICKEITAIMAREMAFDNCSIMLKNDKGTHLNLVAGCGKGDRYRRARLWPTGTCIKSDEGIAGKAFSSGCLVFSSDVKRDQYFKQMDMSVTVSSLLSVPIKAGDEVIGVINLSHPLHSDIYEGNMENIMILLANFVGQVITLSKLYAGMVQWNKKLKDEVELKTEELTRKNRQLRKLALIDPMTGIFNRRFFFKRLEEEFVRIQRYGVQFSLLFIDIDNLKPINDTYGHLAGDRVIKALAKNLRDIGRRGDVSCRLGGDEFGYMLVESDIQGAYTFAERLRERFMKLSLKGIKVFPTISVGIVNTSSDKFRDHKDVYDAADKALYEAKLVKNSVCIYSKRKVYHKSQLPLIH